MSEVCLSAALPGSYFLYSCSLPRATIGSLTASRRDGQPTRPLDAGSAPPPRACNGVTFHTELARSGEAELRHRVFVADGAVPPCFRRRPMHLHSEPLNCSVLGNLRRLTFDMSGCCRAQPGSSPLDGRVRRRQRWRTLALLGHQYLREQRPQCSRSSMSLP